MNMEGFGYQHPSSHMFGNNVPLPMPEQAAPQAVPWLSQQRPGSPVANLQVDPTRPMYMERPGSPTMGMMPRSESPYMQPQLGPPQMRPRSPSPNRRIMIQQTIEHRPRSPYASYEQPRTVSPVQMRPRSVSPQPVDPQQPVWYHTPHLQDPPGTPPLGRHVCHVDISRRQPPMAPPPDHYAHGYQGHGASMYDRPASPPPQYQQQQYMAPPSPVPQQRQQHYMAAPPSPVPQQRQQHYMAAPPQQQQQQQYTVQHAQYGQPPVAQQPPAAQQPRPRYVPVEELQQQYYAPPGQERQPPCSRCMARAMESQGG